MPNAPTAARHEELRDRLTSTADSLDAMLDLHRATGDTNALLANLRALRSRLDRP